MEITEATREEIKELICQTLEQREQKTAANKTVFRRVCADFEQQLKQFDNWYQVQINIAGLLRIAYQVDATAKLPAEKETDIRQFMLSVLNLMAALRD